MSVKAVGQASKAVGPVDKVRKAFKSSAFVPGGWKFEDNADGAIGMICEVVMALDRQRVGSDAQNAELRQHLYHNGAQSPLVHSKNHQRRSKHHTRSHHTKQQHHSRPRGLEFDQDYNQSRGIHSDQTYSQAHNVRPDHFYDQSRGLQQDQSHAQPYDCSQYGYNFTQPYGHQQYDYSQHYDYGRQQHDYGQQYDYGHQQYENGDAQVYDQSFEQPHLHHRNHGHSQPRSMSKSSHRSSAKSRSHAHPPKRNQGFIDPEASRVTILDDKHSVFSRETAKKRSLPRGTRAVTSDSPVSTRCPQCKQSVMTVIKRHTGGKNVAATAVVAAAGVAINAPATLLPLALTVLDLGSLKRKVHHCPYCDYKMGKHVTITIPRD
ncbi:hypothetical protein COEREDRAFT_82353 [Coemansia reversa NRRL 1564]|uniref:LITAF domain-containing protein n=1 Tax=Coemansia reversa (strain ATCC 12441 / NRRL 1564) TaxID=763665 RepID=A0A2G5B7E5_COERN|nr:hypothetical protein COEREDRAFT_82353 [Coemansia reversa NRRL 1564]|eukprot:PIA14921.1 hypothetical protein COEREDRAFT_82353 [Coemansia reversa NRRL 1564]